MNITDAFDEHIHCNDCSDEHEHHAEDECHDFNISLEHYYKLDTYSFSITNIIPSPIVKNVQIVKNIYSQNTPEIYREVEYYDLPPPNKEHINNEFLSLISSFIL